MHRNAPRAAAVYGVDLGKNRFHVVGLDERGAVVQRVTFRCDPLLAFFTRASPSLGGHGRMPRIPGAGAQASAMGHTVRIVPAQFVVEERYHRCPGDRRGGDSADDALHLSPNDRADRSAGVAPDQGPTGQKPHTPDQPVAGLVPRVWRGNPAGHWRLPLRSAPCPRGRHQRHERRNAGELS